MKKIITLLVLFISVNVKADSWVQMASFPGLGLDNPFSFSIGNKGYVGCGRSSAQVVQNSFWEFDPSINAWTQKANFGGVARFQASAFSIGNKGYAGLGYPFPTSLSAQDFWEYDPNNNLWTQKANFGGGNRLQAVGFSIGNMGYFGTGYNWSTIFNDLWQYNPTTDTWVQKTSLPGLARKNSSSFVIGNNGYIVAGVNGSGYLNELWEYNSISDSWFQKANFPSTTRIDGSAFSICDKGYFGLGETSSSPPLYLKDFWEYNSVSNSWIQKAIFPGVKRNESAHFSIGYKGYVGLGQGNGLPFYNDFYEYTPDSACGIPTIISDLESSDLNFTIYPNPAREEFTVYGLQFQTYKLKVFDSNGKVVLTKPVAINNNQLSIINCNLLPTGIYFVQVSDGENKVVKKLSIL